MPAPKSPPVSPVLLDTCAAIWLMARAPMSVAALHAIRAARRANLGVYVSPFTAWEIGTLVSKGRMQLTLTPDVWFATLLALPGVRLAPLTQAELLASTALPSTPPSDPADRIIAATARLHGQVLITRDHKLLAYSREGHIRVQAC
jgi:PIN domain nuclease of toxin-antitoxin system